MGSKQHFERDCTRCGGTGKVSVSDSMADTLAAIGKGATLQQVAKKLKASENTVFSRAQRLLTQGLIERTTTDGRVFVYKQAGGGK